MQILVNDLDLVKKGVYKITNALTNDVYVGSTTQSFNQRLRQHKTVYNKYNSGCEKSKTMLYEAIKQYHHSNFIFEIVTILQNDNKIRELEQHYIQLYNSTYNKYKTISTNISTTNTGRKFDDEWKAKIREKSLLYKHSPNVLVKKSQQNKELSSKYEIYRNNILLFTGSLKDCSVFCNSDISSLCNWVKGKYLSQQGYVIVKLKSQMKKIIVSIESQLLTFNSFNDCDKYFDKWRGYTSTVTLQNKLLLGKYSYEII